MVEEEELLGEMGELPLMLRAMVAIGERPGPPHRYNITTKHLFDKL